MWTCPNCGREFKRTNQNHYCGNAPVSIDEYISRQEQDIQPLLINIRNAIHSAIPEAEETIAWGMPTWKRKSNIIHFAVNKNHIGIYAGQEAVDYFKDKLQDFDIEKGNIHLKTNQDIPLALIAEIAKWCYSAD